MSEYHDADLIVASLNMAAATRGGDVDGVIFHSDRGSEYTSEAYETACRPERWPSQEDHDGTQEPTQGDFEVRDGR